MKRELLCAKQSQVLILTAEYSEKHIKKKIARKLKEEVIHEESYYSPTKKRKLYINKRSRKQQCIYKRARSQRCELLEREESKFNIFGLDGHVRVLRKNHIKCLKYRISNLHLNMEVPM